MKSNLIKFILTLGVIMSFQWWLMAYQQGDAVFAQIPIHGNDGVIIDGEIILDTRSEEVLWSYSKWIPKNFEKKFYQISWARGGSIRGGGGTLIDEDVFLRSITDFVLYLPRALQIGLFSPFPEFWSGEGSTPAMTMARKIIGAVTLIFYFCLFGLLCAFFKYTRNIKFLSILIFSLLGILLYSYVYANVGALVRVRYVFYMVLVSFGLAYIAQYLQDRLSKYGSNKDKIYKT